MSEVDVVETEGGDDVTFVNGHAVEQETSGDEPTGDHGDERAEAIAAVKKALAEEAKEEGKRAAKEAKEHTAKDPLAPKPRGSDGKFLTDDPIKKEKDAAVKKLEVETEEAEPPSETAGQLKRQLRERAELAKAKAEAAAELEKDRAETRRFYQQLEQEKREIAAEREKFARLRKDPIAAIRENGWDPEKFILDIAMDGTPEGQKARAERDLMERLERAESWQKQQEQQAEEYRQQQAHQRKVEFRGQVEREFLKEAFANEHLAGLYKGNEAGLLAQADVVADRYREITTVRDQYGRVVVPGKEATAKEIAEFLEERTAKWYKSKSGQAALAEIDPADRQSATVTKGSPTQGKATGKKSLGPNGSGERRTLGSSLKDADGDERIALANEAVRAAIALAGDS
jgi:hypothetical protein